MPLSIFLIYSSSLDALQNGRYTELTNKNMKCLSQLNVIFSKDLRSFLRLIICVHIFVRCLWGFSAISSHLHPNIMLTNVFCPSGVPPPCVHRAMPTILLPTSTVQSINNCSRLPGPRTVKILIRISFLVVLTPALVALQYPNYCSG